MRTAIVMWASCRLVPDLLAYRHQQQSILARDDTMRKTRRDADEGARPQRGLLLAAGENGLTR